MKADLINVNQLQNLIGSQVSYDGRPCQIIEILEDGPALILQHQEQRTTIQPDQHGEAHRRVPSTITIPVLDHQSDELHPKFVSLNVTHLL